MSLSSLVDHQSRNGLSIEYDLMTNVDTPYASFISRFMLADCISNMKQRTRDSQRMHSIDLYRAS